MKKVKKTVTIPEELAKWAESIIKSGEYPGIRSLSRFVEYLIRNEEERKK